VAALIYLDTHVAAWMFAGQVSLLPPAVQAYVETCDLLISPAVELELQYLFEIRRTTEPSAVVVETLQREVGLKVCDLPFRDVVAAALAQSWTRDPFDRLIVSQAVLRGAPLATRDRIIRAHCPLAFWEGGPVETAAGSAS
jgi:PIN domain nuclease of toxin-antitoxin system